MSYDAAGNLTNDTYTGAGSRVYDAENRMTKAWGGNNQWQEYTYNADGQRTRRKIDGVETRQVYGIEGELLAEYSATAVPSTPQKEYGYRNGQLLVTAELALANVALASNGGTASASSFLGPPNNFYPSYVNDGARTSINGGIWLDGTYQSWPDWIQVDFNGSKTISEIDVITQQDNYQNPIEPTLSQTFSLYGITAFDVQYWNGSSWVTVPGGSVTGNNKVWRQFTFSPITTSKIRVMVNAGQDNTYSRVVEVEAWTASSGGSSANVNWLVADQLGTPRIVLDKTGSLGTTKRHDYLPFGEELFAGMGGRTTALGYTADTIRQKFTAYERDNETGLDYAKARYYAYIHGRFTGPDPLPASAKATVPQSWNRYCYVLNNPLKFIDPSGMMWVYHFLNKQQTKIGIGWIDGNKIPKDLAARGYKALDFGNQDSKKVTLSDGRVALLKVNEAIPEFLGRVQQSNSKGAYVNTGLIREIGRRTDPLPEATAVFVVGSVAGGVAVVNAGPLMLLNATAYAVTTAHEVGQGDQQPPGQIEAGTRAVEYPAGQISQTGFLDSAQKYLGPGYKELSPGRYVSADGMRQVRFGAHETRGPGLHAHFEAYDMPGGKVVENSIVRIRQ